ncbi:MAG TPA: phosphoribosylglycinamide formyltransferase [Gemmatimonadaceae bacterium]|nr:phosphoribosylglycinamide formyltransferase [Gemmatimonadaceae bacterium]
MTARIAVFASGRGSNLQALHAYLERTGGAEVVLVASDRPAAGALAWARDRGTAAATLESAGRDAQAMLDVLSASRIDCVVLAGYLRLVPPEVVRAYHGRIVNVHPALLPAFGGPGMYGERVHRAVLQSGARVSGPTVHFVDEVYDHGAIIAQWPVPVFADDTESALAARVLRAEHLLLPRVAHLVATGRLAPNHQARGLAAPAMRERAAFFLATPEDDALAESMASALGG